MSTPPSLDVQSSFWYDMSAGLWGFILLAGGAAMGLFYKIGVMLFTYTVKDQIAKQIAPLLEKIEAQNKVLLEFSTHLTSLRKNIHAVITYENYQSCSMQLMEEALEKLVEGNLKKNDVAELRKSIRDLKDKYFQERNQRYE